MHKVIQNRDPSKWMEHRYGLSVERWNSLQCKSVWITGAGTGYGRCMAIALAAAGGTVFLRGRRREKLFETIREMELLKIPTDKCQVIVADISDIGHVKAACSRIMSLSD